MAHRLALGYVWTKRLPGRGQCQFARSPLWQSPVAVVSTPRTRKFVNPFTQGGFIVIFWTSRANPSTRWPPTEVILWWAWNTFPRRTLNPRSSRAAPPSQAALQIYASLEAASSRWPPNQIGLPRAASCMCWSRRPSTWVPSRPMEPAMPSARGGFLTSIK